MSLAIFDLDNTLLNGDSDVLWGEFLVEQGLVEADYYERENLRFYEEYKAGTLDIMEFLAFSLKPLSEHSLDELNHLHRQFMAQKIEAIMQPAAARLLQQHREQGDFLLIITATNSFVTRPIAEALGVDDILATEPELLDGRYTGKVSGLPTFREGKVERLQQWLANSPHDLDQSWFYSDSLNDLPLLEVVTHPIAVDADETLLQHARMKGWTVMSLRTDSGQPETLADDA
ncbi:MAG: HAD-IB family hydrolase [Gammaproteobacteria bacterium]|nr:HAD-IB family hydrolase [Gammaproteobacteria bacterium]